MNEQPSESRECFMVIVLAVTVSSTNTTPWIHWAGGHAAVEDARAREASGAHHGVESAVHALGAFHAHHAGARRAGLG